jgi:uncharacterized protein YhbP (UPF0306 family)
MGPRLTLLEILNADGSSAGILPETVSARRIQRSVFRVLRQNVLCSLATVTAKHRAHINTAYFCYSNELELYFLSHPSSLHCRNLAMAPSAAMAIFGGAQKWGGPDRGIQLFGVCRVVKGVAATRARRLYGKRFPAYARWQVGLPSRAAARAYRIYRFVVSRLKILDEREFGDGIFVVASVGRARDG